MNLRTVFVLISFVICLVRSSDDDDEASVVILENTTASLSLSAIGDYHKVSHVLNTTDAGSVLRRYIIACDNSNTHTLEIYVRIARHNEATVETRVWHDGASEGDATTESRQEYRKTCNDVFDECFVSKYFRYGAVPGLEDARPMYTGREAVRIDNPHGEWVLDIVGQLPHDGVVHIQVVIVQLQYTYIAAVVGGCGASCAFVAALFFLWGWIKSRNPRRVNGPATAEDEETTDGSRVSGILDRARGSIRRFLPNIGSVFRYRRVRNEDQADDAAPVDTTAHTTAAPPIVEEDEDLDRICRICRGSAPQSDLFAPCKCNGTMKYIHRQCLQQWREATTNPQNKLRCSECHAKFVIVQHENSFEFVTHMGGRLGRILCFIAGVEITLLVLGYAFKGVIVLVTFSPSNVDWSPDNFYHHFIGVVIIVSALYNMVIIVDPLCNMFQWQWTRMKRRSLVAASLLLNIPTGYIAKFLLWSLTSVPWDWTVSYGSGFLILVFVNTYILPTVQRAYHRWSESHRNERVVEPEEEMATV
jgi:hypothetical protein